MNRFIVHDYLNVYIKEEDYLNKLKDIFKIPDIMKKPETIFDVDKKGCCLIVYRQPVVLARTGSRRVRYRGKEHGANVTLVSCGNALGTIVPLMVIFRGPRMKREWTNFLLGVF